MSTFSFRYNRFNLIIQRKDETGNWDFYLMTHKEKNFLLFSGTIIVSFKIFQISFFIDFQDLPQFFSLNCPLNWEVNFLESFDHRHDYNGNLPDCKAFAKYLPLPPNSKPEDVMLHKWQISLNEFWLILNCETKTEVFLFFYTYWSFVQISTLKFNDNQYLI